MIMLGLDPLRRISTMLPPSLLPADLDSLGSLRLEEFHVLRVESRTWWTFCLRKTMGFQSES